MFRAEFRAHRDMIRLRMPLFRGTGPTDHKLSPMADLHVDLDQIVPVGTKYRLSYRMNKNKTVELTVMFDITRGQWKAAELRSVDPVAG